MDPRPHYDPTHSTLRNSSFALHPKPKFRTGPKHAPVSGNSEMIGFFGSSCHSWDKVSIRALRVFRVLGSGLLELGFRVSRGFWV